MGFCFQCSALDINTRKAVWSCDDDARLSSSLECGDCTMELIKSRVNQQKSQDKRQSDVAS